MLDGCSKSFMKQQGVYVSGKWFCCEEHADQDPDIKRIKEMQMALEAKR